MTDRPIWLPLAAWVSGPLAVLVELGLYRSYEANDARFHWYTHAFVGGGLALLLMAAWTIRTRRPAALPIAWMVLGHLIAMFPDLLFKAGHIAHRRWMDVFLGHLTSHYLPGRNLGWLAIFLVCLGAYLAALDRVRGAELHEALHVEHWGSGGPEVVFLHGLGASSRYWRDVAGALPAVDAIAPDLLGFGLSPKPEDATYDVACHLDHLEPHVPDGAIVVGHSTGAILALALAARHPGRIRGMVLLGLPAAPDRGTAVREIGSLGAMERLTVTGNPLAHLQCAVMCALRPLLVPLAPRLVHDIPGPVAADFLRHTWTSYSRTLRRVVIDHRLEGDAAVAPPTLLITGVDDRDAPVEHVEVLAARHPDRFRLRVVAGGHHIALDQPSVVADAVESIIRSTDAPREASASVPKG